LNWIDFVIIGILVLSFIAGIKKSIAKAVLNVIIAAILIKFMIYCLDRAILPETFAEDIRQSFLMEKFRHPLAGIKAIERRQYEVE
jgi:hypothetical protein